MERKKKPAKQLILKTWNKARKLSKDVEENRKSWKSQQRELKKRYLT